MTRKPWILRIEAGRAIVPKWLWRLFLFACVYGIYYILAYETWLPRDKEMIAQFRAHRAEFEEVVRRHRAFKESKYSDKYPLLIGSSRPTRKR
jgi:hypothetical protein